MYRLILILLFFTSIFSKSFFAQVDCNSPLVNIGRYYFGSFTNADSGMPKPTCGSNINRDTWLRFNASASTVTIEGYGLNCNIGFEIWNGTCPDNLKWVICSESRKCGTNNNPAITINNLTVGAEYFIRVWPETTPLAIHWFSIFITDNSYENFNGVSGSAQLGSNNDCVILTSGTNQNGCAWYSKPVLNNIEQWSTVDLTYTLNFGNQGAAARDGMAFVMSTDMGACGSGGYGLGAEGMPNSLIIEFDTWDDGVAGNTVDVPDDHITVFFNGDFTTPIYGPVTIPSLPEFSDGNDHIFRMIWNPISWSFQVYFDGQLIINDGGNNFITSCFGGYTYNMFRLVGSGFTGSSSSSGSTFNVCYNPHYQNQPPQNETINQIICDGYTYTSPGGIDYTTTGTFTESIIDANGCAATRFIRLTVRPKPSKTENVVICPGDNYLGYDQSGQYQFLRVGNNCDTNITLNLMVLDYQVLIQKLTDLTCKIDTTTITSAIPFLPSNPDFAPTITYEWITFDGLILSGQGTKNIKVGRPGSYYLQVSIAGENSGIPYNCIVASDPVDVLLFDSEPIAKINAIGELSCSKKEIVLNGQFSEPFPVDYKWKTTGGNIVSPTTDGFITIDKPGKYFLEVTDPESGCTDTASIIIKKTGFETTAEILKSSEINCLNDSITLSTVITDTNVVRIVWSTMDGNILSDTLLPSINVNKAGEYFLTLYNKDTCSTVVSIQVSADQSIPTVDAGPNRILTCLQSQAFLDGSMTTANNPNGFIWHDLANNVISTTNLDLNVSNPGTYILTVLDSINMCSVSDTVNVISNVLTPTISGLNDQVLTCTNTLIQLQPNVINTQSNAIFTWNTLNGNITGSTNTINTTVDQTGTYTIIVINPDNGCADTTSMNVTGSTDQPTANAGNDVVLDCLNPFSPVIGSFVSNDPNDIDINWNTIGGNIQGATDVLNINVSAPGQYILVITNELNGCWSSDTITVVKNEDKPIILIDPVEDLTCLISSINVNPNWTNSGASPNITWNTPDGNIVSTDANFNIVVDQPGSYNITIVNSETGCITTAGVVVNKNTEPPTGSIEKPDSITCVVLDVDLLFSPGTTGTDYGYQWSTMNGNISSNPNQASVNVTASGDYQLLVTNNENGCTETYNVTVPKSTQLPIVSVRTDEVLNCNVNEITLEGSVSNSTSYDISWTANNGGQITSGANTLNPTISQSGSYVLTIEDQGNGCIMRDTINIIANITMPEFVGPNVQDADCYGVNGSIQFAGIDNSEGALSFTLNGNSVSPQNLLFDQLDYGNYTLEVTDGNGCTEEYVFFIDKESEVSLTLPDTLVLIYGQPYSDLYPSFDFDTTGMNIIGWSGANYLNCTTCINPTLTPTYSTFLTFETISANGCTAEDEVYIRVRKLNGDYYVPNAFTPYDRNGVNDFISVYTDQFSIPKVDEFRIFNRWGEEVFGKKDFEPNKPELGWDGFFKGQKMNPGVFVYFAKLTTIDGYSFVIKGDITLLE